MEAGERCQTREVYRTPISIFDVIRLGRSVPVKREDKEPVNSIPSMTKEKELTIEFYFPKEIF